ncbi:hypothetical protein GUA87_12220 [Sneathiella sp. P13V-1]|uniref:hypothetical protein n=1 Tax=Sneathiella sp. P13V-1 TaxID=2697366 RepID=UPI00187B2E8A|nr:hypothetical protein [Sneathiella sp. P13V-1]MBE7637612.1 hypothetical protein [Sneathiella sp. P13V-1]
MIKDIDFSNLKSKIKIPAKKWQRTLLGWALIFGGIFWFLPVVGFWMLPLGIMVLAIDSAFFRRLRRKMEVWWGRKRQKSRRKDRPRAKGKRTLPRSFRD